MNIVKLCTYICIRTFNIFLEQNTKLKNRCFFLSSWTWNLSSNTESMSQYWGALLVIILHEISHIIRRLEIPTASNIMTATTPPKLLNCKNVREAGNQLEYLLFGDILNSMGDQDSKFLLRKTSWNVESVEIFKEQLNNQINEDAEQQTNENQQNRLQLPCKRDEFDALENNHNELTNRIILGECATSIYQPQYYSSDEKLKFDRKVSIF